MNSNDFQNMMKQFMQNASKIKESYKALSEQNKHKTVEASAGGDWVTAKVNLKLELVGIKFKKELLENELSVVEELVVGAVNQGLEKAKKQVESEMLNVAKEFEGAPGNGFPFPSDKEG